MYTKLRQITERAAGDKTLRFTSLAHLMNKQLLHDSYARLERHAAPGIDGVTWQEYGVEREKRLDMLHESLKAGTYRAQPVRRVHIEKEDGTRRPLGIPRLEDKIVQRAVVSILEAIYEPDFYDCSYGFRPGRSAHDALDELTRLMHAGKVNYVIDADIKGYFEHVVHTELRSLIKRRIADPGLTRLIGKWLKVGVLDEGRLLVSEQGTPQGAVISPLLANVYLHYALDEWWHEKVVPRLRGDAHLIRYADDFLLTFEREDDATRVMKVLPQRLARFGLELHSTKTRLLPFGRCALWLKKCGKLTGGRLPTFDFLGFTHYYAKSLKGHFVYKVQTMAKRLRRALKAMGDWARIQRHSPLREQWEQLRRKMTGYYNYYGRRHNSRSLHRYFRGVRSLWYKWLRRRSEQRHLTWSDYAQILTEHPLPYPRIRHAIAKT